MLINLSTPLENVIDISTDGTPVMTRRNMGVMGLLFNEIKNFTGREIFINHCIIYQQYLCAKMLDMPNVTTPVKKFINFLKLPALNHRQFKELLKNRNVNMMI